MLMFIEKQFNFLGKETIFQMAEKLVTRIEVRNDTAENWASAEAVLNAAEFGYDTTSNKIKIGDGSSKFTELDALTTESDVKTLIASEAPKATVYQESSLDAIDAPIQGDMAIITETISGDKVSRTAYMYNGTGWAALDGNYNASNVYFDEDLTYTADIGVLKLTGGKKSDKFSANGKSLEAVMKSIMAKTEAPTIKAPTYVYKSVGSTRTPNTLEVGAEISKITWDGTWTDGSYSCGYLNADGTVNVSTAAGCTPSYTVSCDKAGTASAQAADGTWTLTDPITIDSVSAKTYATVTVKCDWTASSRQPANNIGDGVDGQLPEGTQTASYPLSLTGYREGFFYGTTTTAITLSADGKTVVEGQLTSDKIRALSKSGAKFAAGTKTMTVPSGAASIILAVPSGKTVDSVLNTTVNSYMTFATGSCNVEGANGYEAAAYTVYVFTPAEPYGSSASLSIVLK